MKIMAGSRSIKKPVILEIPTIIIVTPTGTDIPFLTKMQKKANPIEWELPFCDYKSSKMVVTIRLIFLGLCQQIDITEVFMLCYIIFCLVGFSGSVKSSILPYENYRRLILGVKSWNHIRPVDTNSSMVWWYCLKRLVSSSIHIYSLYSCSIDKTATNLFVLLLDAYTRGKRDTGRAQYKAKLHKWRVVRSRSRRAFDGNRQTTHAQVDPEACQQGQPKSELSKYGSGKKIAGLDQWWLRRYSKVASIAQQLTGLITRYLGWKIERAGMEGIWLHWKYFSMFE